MKQAAAVAVAALALSLASGCSELDHDSSIDGSFDELTQVGAPAAVPSSLASPVDGVDGVALEWGECPGASGPAQECALLTVPLDYDEPSGPTIRIAVSRIRAASPVLRRGVLLLNPGGPGGPGLDLPELFAQLFPPSLLDRYDLIGFDPRGIGRSAPVTCALTPEQQDLTLVIPWPTGPGRIEGNVAYARSVAESCADASTADLLPFITTANTARDMDRIRAALGEDTISYFAYSYGSYLGAVYASLFPERSDRIVLDSVVHPGRIWRDSFRAWGPAIEIRFPDFTRWAAERNDTYGLGATPADVRRLYFELGARLDREPIEVIGLLFTGNLFREFTRGSLYDDSLFANLAAVWQTIDAGNGEDRAADLADALAEVFPDRPADGVFAGIWAVLCDDAQWPESPDRYRADVSIDGALFPIAGAMAANIWPCAFWMNEPREPAVPILRRHSGNILLVQGLRDPATPYDGAWAMRWALGNRSRLLSVEVGGHGLAYLKGNACADDAVTSFLETGRLPRTDGFCRAEPAVESPPALGDELSARERAGRELRRRSYPF